MSFDEFRFTLKLTVSDACGLWICTYLHLIRCFVMRSIFPVELRNGGMDFYHGSVCMATVKHFTNFHNLLSEILEGI